MFRSITCEWENDNLIYTRNDDMRCVRARGTQKTFISLIRIPIGVINEFTLSTRIYDQETILSSYLHSYECIQYNNPR